MKKNYKIQQNSYDACAIAVRYEDGTETQVHFMFTHGMDKMREMFWWFVHQRGTQDKLPGCERT